MSEPRRGLIGNSRMGTETVEQMSTGALMQSGRADGPRVIQTINSTTTPTQIGVMDTLISDGGDADYMGFIIPDFPDDQEYTSSNDTPLESGTDESDQEMGAFGYGGFGSKVPADLEKRLFALDTPEDLADLQKLLREHGMHDLVFSRVVRNKKNPLHCVKDPECAAFILKDVADLRTKDDEGRSPLHTAAMNNAVEVFKVFSKFACERGFGPEIHNQIDNQGNTPLHIAADTASLGIVQAVLDSPVDVNTRNIYGKTALHISAAGTDPKIVEAMIVKKADPRICDNFKMNAAHYAARSSYERGEILVFITRDKRVVNMRDCNGKTPVQYANEGHYNNKTHVLVSSGADVTLLYESKPIQADSDRTVLEKYNSTLGLEEHMSLDKTNFPIPAESDKYDILGYKLTDATVPRLRAYSKKDKALNEWLTILENAYTKDELIGIHGARFTNAMRKYGIHPLVRGRVWLMLLGINNQQTDNDGAGPAGALYGNATSYKTHHLYSVIGAEKKRAMATNNTEGSAVCTQIDLDVNRTCRTHKNFEVRYGPGQISLFLLLWAYSLWDSDIGYCQGIGTLACAFLMYLNETDAFTCLKRVMTREQFNMRELFRLGFPGLNEAFYVHDKLIERHLPAVSEHLKELNITAIFYSTKWYLGAFMDVMPPEFSLRIWEMMLWKGFDYMFTICLNMMAVKSKRLVTMTFDEVLTYLNDYSELYVKPEEFMVQLTRMSVAQTEVDELRDQYQNPSRR